MPELEPAKTDAQVLDEAKVVVSPDVAAIVAKAQELKALLDAVKSKWEQADTRQGQPADFFRADLATEIQGAICRAGINISVMDEVM